MIHVDIPAPPPHYHTQVREPGNTFLLNNPHPSKTDWDRHRYWSKIHGALYSNLHGICSYCATYTPRRQDQRFIDHTSIDHFVPKGKIPALAYEWTNFRLARAKLNNRKGEHEDVIDPYALADGWFRLSFTTFLLYPDPNLPDNHKQNVTDTIERLELNLDDKLVQERTMAVYAYADGKLHREKLIRFYPFIASEMTSQDFDTVHLPKFRRILRNPIIRSRFGL